MTIEKLLSAPQLGEYAWHQITVDPNIVPTSESHLATMRRLIGVLPSRDRPFRVLELGAYRHYAGHLLATETGAEVWLSDISAAALRAGRQAAEASGVSVFAALCAADFHDLPFSDGYFDAAFIASAVHHTIRPEQVLRELMRVVGPNGVVWLDNEPVGREACFYRFASNRPESYTDFERRVADRDLMRLLSSPFPGTRPEAMFHMTENDQIPLDAFMHELEAGGAIEHLQLRTDSTIGEPEKRLMAVDRSTSRRHGAAAAIHHATRILLDSIGAPDPKAEALGFSLPNDVQIWSMSRRLALVLGDSDAAHEHRLTRAFGAALQARVRRPAHATYSMQPFRRHVQEVDGCWMDFGPSTGADVLKARALLPDAFDPDCEALLREMLRPDEWSIIRESFGANSLCNLKPSVELPALRDAEAAVLLLRAYTLPDARGPYLVRVRQGRRLVVEGSVVQAESRLFRGLVHRDQGEIVLEHLDPAGRALDISHNLRIGVLQFVALAAD